MKRFVAFVVLCNSANSFVWYLLSELNPLVSVNWIFGWTKQSFFILIKATAFSRQWCLLPYDFFSIAFARTWKPSNMLLFFFNLKKRAVHLHMQSFLVEFYKLTYASFRLIRNSFEPYFTRKLIALQPLKLDAFVERFSSDDWISFGSNLLIANVECSDDWNLLIPLTQEENANAISTCLVEFCLHTKQILYFAKSYSEKFVKTIWF